MCVLKIKDAGSDVENFCALLVRMKNGIATIQQFGSPSKIIKKTIIRSRNHSFEFMSKGDKMRMSRTYLESHIHCCNVHNNQGRKTAQCPWADKSIKKMWCIYTLESDSAL